MIKVQNYIHMCTVFVDSTITINIFMVTIGILSFGTAIPVWYIYDNCIRNKEGINFNNMHWVDIISMYI